MATEALSAFSGRVPMKLARPPRVVSDRTSMARTALQPHARYAEAGYTGEALRIFGKVPGWAIAHALDDNSMAPLFRAGEVAVVESDGKPGWMPQEGNLYLIEYVSVPVGGELYARRTRRIIMPRLNGGAWWAGPLAQRRGSFGFMSDGPYRDECDLAGKLIGRVVGIYNPGAFAAGGSL